MEKNKCVIIVGFRGYNGGYNVKMLDKLNKENIVKVYALDFQGRIAVEWDSMISEEYLASKTRELELLRNHLCDDESQASLNAFIHQKMYSEYEKPYSKCRQYFEDGIIQLGENESFVDCGGFDGEDTFFFLNQMKGRNGRAYIFEPDPSNHNRIKDRFQSDGRVVIYNMGVSDKYGRVYFESSQGSNSRITESGDTVVEVGALDNILGERKITFLKMDIEGYELQALFGAEKLIKRNRPKMAICVYHRREDIFTIPEYILSLRSDYKFYFRNYHPASTEAVLYAV